MNQASIKVLEILKDSERLADQVLQNKHELIALDKRRQSTREAIRDIGKNSDKKVWITIGPILVKMERLKALDLMKKGECRLGDPQCGSHTEEKIQKNIKIKFDSIRFTDQQSIDIETNKLRSEQKVLVSKLRELECQAPIVGFDLKPLDRNELSALSANLPGF